MGRRRFHIVTAVWGGRYVDTFMATSLRSLLAPGNIPALIDQHEAVYRVFTTPPDAERLAGSEIIAKLRDIIPVEFVDAGSFLSVDKYRNATDLYRRALDSAVAADAAAILITPDAIWADGTLRRVASLAQDGFRAVLMDGPRAVREPFLAELNRRIPADDDGAIAASARELTRLAAEFPHPYEAATTWDQPWLHDVPFMLHWAVPREGMLTRGFCRYPIMAAPRTAPVEFHGATDHGLIWGAFPDPAEIHHVSDSDEMAKVSLQELGASSACFKRTDNHRKILQVAKWALKEANPQNLDAVRHPCRRHFGAIEEAKWRRAERRSERHIDAILMCRKVLAIHAGMATNGARRAAGVLAFALIRGDLPARLGKPRPITVFAPSDVAFKKHDRNVRGWIGNGDHAAIRRGIAGCAADGAMEWAEIVARGGKLTSIGGGSIDVSDIRASPANIRVEDCLLHVVDDVPALPSAK